MLDKLLQKETLSIVLVGVFNPAIFQPIWFSLKGLLRESETENAKIEVIHPEVARYTISDWFSVDVTKSRCEFKTYMEPYFDVLKDVVSGSFQILKETPINAIGVNNIFDISLSSPEQYYKFGKELTPLDLWDDSLKDARLLTLEILEQESKDYDNLSRRIRITPTNPDDKISNGVSININNHFVVKESGILETISIIKNSPNSIRDYSKDIANKIITKVIHKIEEKK